MDIRSTRSFKSNKKAMTAADTRETLEAFQPHYSTKQTSLTDIYTLKNSFFTDIHCTDQFVKNFNYNRPAGSAAGLGLAYLPDKSPAIMVEMMGVFLSLTRARNEKSRPSRAIAKIIRGSGNMEPRRLSRR